MPDYTDVLEAIREHGNLSKACRETGAKKGTFLDACDRDPDLADRYARAREAGLDAEADRAIEEATQAEDAQLGRLALDARKWYLSKLLPKRYGDKVDVTTAGEKLPGGAPDMSGLSEAALREIAALKTSGQG